MPRFLTADWVDAFNEAVAGMPPPSYGEETALAARSGSFRVAEQVADAPEGAATLLLTVDERGVRLALRTGIEEEALGEEGTAPNVTIVLGYADAVALATGELTPAQALGDGRVRVRGDLAVLAAGQQVLAEARRHAATLAAETTY